MAKEEMPTVRRSNFDRTVETGTFEAVEKSPGESWNGHLRKQTPVGDADGVCGTVRHYHRPAGG
jgi:hypothetical protein